MFHTPFDEVTDLQRRNAKAVNFGIVYGISSFGLSQDLSITRKEAAEYIDRYFETYPGIKKFLDDAVAHAKEQGYVVTLFGRRRPVPELSSSNFMQRQFGERVAMNPGNGCRYHENRNDRCGQRASHEKHEIQAGSAGTRRTSDRDMEGRGRGSAGDPERRHDACGRSFRSA